MATNNKFNLLKYVYGRLYAGTFESNCVKEERRKIYSWIKPINWLKKEGYISYYKVEKVDEKYSIITYGFNHNKLMYEYYLKAIARNIQQCFVPTGEAIYQKKIDSFEQERLDKFEKAVEYIDKDDRIRRTMTREEIMAA